MDLSLTPMIAQVKAQVAALKHVGGAADFGAAARDLKLAPAAFLVPLRAVAGPNMLDSADTVMQRIAASFGVIYGVSNLMDASGAKSEADLAPIREATIGALIGWRPSADHDTCLYAAGRLLALGDRVLWWQDDFTTAFYARKV